METLTSSSKDAVYWLTDTNGIDLSKVAQLGGQSFPRTHRGGPGQKTPGASIIGTLLEILGKKSDLFKLRTGARITKVLRESDEFIGVEYETGDGNEVKTESISGPVVFATGGFAGMISPSRALGNILNVFFFFFFGAVYRRRTRPSGSLSTRLGRIPVNQPTQTGLATASHSRWSGAGGHGTSADPSDGIH